MDVRVELALGCHRSEPLTLEELLQLAVDELYALLELRQNAFRRGNLHTVPPNPLPRSAIADRCLRPLRGLQHPLQVVEHWEKLLDDPLAGPRDQRLLVARGPLAVVVEVGFDALEGVDQLLVLVAERLELDVLDLFLLLNVLRHYDFFASSSSSMTS